jgi:hypothetical protein
MNNPTRTNVILITITLLIIAGFIWYIQDLKTDYRIEKSANEYKRIQQSIDSVEAKRTEVIETVSKKSQSNADRAQTISKTVTNEKPIIRDTTYTAMCEYITNYRP